MGTTTRPAAEPLCRAMMALLLLGILLAAGEAGAGAVQGHLETHTLHSKIFAEDRTLLVWVPEVPDSVDGPPLPLLLALQGENLFDADRAAGGNEWAVDELLATRPSGIPPFLVVGVVSAPHAIREFATPGSRPDAGAPLLLEYLVDEVLPFVEARWNVTHDAAERYLMGMGNSSWTAVYGAWVQSRVFSGALAFDLPDADPVTMTWPQKDPQRPFPWLWLEQTTAERDRSSNSSVFANLRRAGDVHIVVAGPQASRPARLAAALRAVPMSRIPGSDSR